MRRSNAVYKFLLGCFSKDYDAPSGVISLPDLLALVFQARLAASGGRVGAQLAEQGLHIQVAAQRTLRAFGQLANIYEHLAKLLGSSTRVCELLDVLDQLRGGSLAKREQGTRSDTASTIVLQGVSIVTPTGMCLADNLSLTVQQSQSLVVTGHNGSGKTAFFRTVAGLWPLRCGLVSTPPKSLLLVPQRTYCPFGTLRDQVTYPERLAEPTKEQDTAVRAALEVVGVTYLEEREGGLGAKRYWEDVLSLGEQQRLGLARVFYHRPKFAVLDECTDAVSADVEEQLYRSLSARGITTITISKRLSLPQFHSQALALGCPTAKGWQLERLA